MLIYRYFAREVLNSLLAITVLLLLIFLSNLLVTYLSQTASGELASLFIFHLLALEVPHFLGLLLPLGLYLGVILAYGRLHSDSEMVVMSASGVSRQRLLWMTMSFAAVVALVVALFTLWLIPSLLLQRNALLAKARSASVVDFIMPGHFQSQQKGRSVLYVENVTKDRSAARRVFIARRDRDAVTLPHNPLWEVVFATKARVRIDESTGRRLVVLENGQRYHGRPGAGDVQAMRFLRYAFAIPSVTVTLNKKEKSMGTALLFPLDNKNPRYAAEIQWRLSAPLMVMVLMLLALPLSEVNPRQGRYAHVLPAVILYIIYANLLFVAKDWVKDGNVSPAFGLWWVHGIFLSVAAILWLWTSGGLWRRGARRGHPKRVTHS